MLIRKYPSLHFNWGSGIDAVQDVVADDQGNMYLIGTTQSSDFPVGSSYLNKSPTSNYDVFLSMFTLNGIL